VDEEETIDDVKPPITSLDEWIKRELPAPDYLLGQWLTTTTRCLLWAPTGIGKTMFGISLAMRVTAGANFLHWRGSGEPRRTLYIDGEMSRRLLRERLIDEAHRFGSTAKGMQILSHEDIQKFAPLNTPEGQRQIEKEIERLGGFDLIIFDNIM